MSKTFSLINKWLGWFIGFFASAIYITTAEPTASWWDCGEYIATTYKLLVGHPPGAPTFQLFGKVFTLFSGGDLTQVAFMVNSMSAIMSGLTIMLLFWTITMLGKKLVANLGGFTPLRSFAIIASALVGALTYTFSDTFWFSAVEGEVYAMSSFFTALVFWCILKWDEEYVNRKEGVNPNRWLILIFYLVGLSIGVHLLNLLTLPAIVLVVYFRMNSKASIWGVTMALAFISVPVAIFFPTAIMFLFWLFVSAPLFYLSAKNKAFQSRADWGVLWALAGSVVLLGAILYGIIPGIVNFAGKFEIFSVNSIGLPFNVGTVIYFLAIIALVIYGVYYAVKKQKKWLTIAAYSFAFLLIGYSTFLTLVIRSNANPTIDENNPEDAVQLLAYLNREQYGTNPLFYGHTFASEIVNYQDGNPVYVRDDASGEYIISNDRKDFRYQYRADQNMFFPRMWDASKKANYINWLRSEYSSGSASDKEQIRHLQRGKVPTWGQNTMFLRTYQMGYMYFRYFMWNFSGRQNDLQGRGDMINGNWITGIPFVDNALVGNQSDLPRSLERRGHNKYYMLPFLLGLIGLLWYSQKDAKNSFVVGLLFVMTGIAIGFYLNMYAFQPRERDYAFAASYYAFSIWIGFGVFALINMLEKLKNKNAQMASAICITLLCIGFVPGVMAQQNWDDHDRSHRYTAVAFAKNFLDSCAPNAIIFTMGDNDTFPLWYVQEVEEYRTDVRVCNLSLANAQWYIDQMKQKAYQSEPLPISLTWDQYKDGTRDQIILDQANGNYTDLKQFMDFIKQQRFDQRFLLFKDGYQGAGPNIPASFSISVDKEKVLANGTVNPKDSALVVDKLTWNIPGSDQVSIIKANIMMLDILANNNWERPIYFASILGSDAFFGLEEYFQLDGLAYRLVPIRSQRNRGTVGRIDTEILSNNLLNTFSDHSRIDRVNNPDAPAQEPYPYLWGGINDPRVFQNEDNCRLFRVVRDAYQRLAEAYMMEGNVKQAEEVLNFGNTLLNDEILPYITANDIGNAYSNVNYLSAYFKVGTPTATQKGVDMANVMLEEIKETFEWLNNSNERTRSIHAETIENLMIIVSQFKLLVPATELDKMPLLKEIQLGEAGKVYLSTKSAALGGAMQRLAEDQNGVINVFREYQNFWDVATLLNDETSIQEVNALIDHALGQLRAASPQLADGIEQHLFPDRNKTQLSITE